LQGIATGDAIGKQTEGLSPEQLSRWYPHGISGFEGRPDTVIPRYVGNAKREWRIGETTDDTERTLAVARAIVVDRQIAHAGIGREMLACTKCIHPGLRSLWEFHQAADPMRVATGHDGCGAAIRVSPVGIVVVSSSMEELVIAAREASISTHGGSLAIAAAAATAAAVSAAIDAASPLHILEHAEGAATMAEGKWPGKSGAAFAKAIRCVFDDLRSLPMLDAADISVRCFPNQPLTIVPLALALATLMQSAEDAILLAANIGGDSDSVASIAGGILGARHPSTVNQQWCEVVARVNNLDLAAVGNQLAPFRHGAS
jgi:ADP-ribosylglycohydrolase